LWFALGAGRRLTVDAPRGAVLYRIQRERLADLEPRISASRDCPPADACRHVYCFDTPDAVSRRPRLQHGWSLAGWDDPWLYFALVAQRAIEAFSLPVNTPAAVIAAVAALGDILPEPDPVTLIVDSVLSCDQRVSEFLSYLQSLGASTQGLALLLDDANLRAVLRHGWLG
jgi:hypothetical protein